MNCPYCNIKCLAKEDIYHDGGGLAYTRFECPERRKCPTRIRYLLNKEKELVDISFLWEEEPNKRFRVFNNLVLKFCTVQYQIYNDKDWKVDEIEMNYIPKWNPQTIKNKVKIYKTFS